MTCMCEVAREEWIASERPGVSMLLRRRTCHSNRPPRRMNGRKVRFPWSSGGSSSARTLPKRQSVRSFVHNCPTERRESRMDGTQRRVGEGIAAKLIL
eukprot:6029081-Pleurochrysis_carterae.AAC.3